MANRGDGDSISEWFRQVPLVTKVLSFGTLLSGCLVSFKILPMVLSYYHIIILSYISYYYIIILIYTYIIIS